MIDRRPIVGDLSLSTPSRRRMRDACSVATITIAAAVLIGFRLHAFSLPLETDECNYAYIGARLLDGDQLYVDVWDHQPPGVFILFAAVTALVGQSDAVFRWLATGFSLASLMFLYRIVRGSYSFQAALLASALFAVVSSDPGTAGEGCNREIFMNVFALAAVEFLTHRPTPTLKHTILAGTLIGLGSALKTVMAAQWFMLVIWLVAIVWIRSRSWLKTGLYVLAMGIGPALIWLAIGAYFAATERWGAFVDAVFRFNLGYCSTTQPFLQRFIDVATTKPYIFDSGRPLWIAGSVAFAGLLIFTRKNLLQTDGAIVAYTLGSFLAVCLPAQFWPHYYYLLIPPLVLTCAVAFHRLGLVIRVHTRLLGMRLAAAGWFLIVLLTQAFYYLLIDPQLITAPRYDFREQWARAQAMRVKRLTDPDDGVFVWGRDVGIYYYSRRQCASRYTMVGALDQNTAGHQQRREILMRELKSHPPRLVLIVEEEFDALRTFLQSRYVVAGADMDDDDPKKIIMLALMDRNRPVDLIDWEWTAPRKSFNQ